jgi:hypothetical protein
VTRSAEDRLARALDRLQSGGPAAVTGRDLEIQDLLETAGYLHESLTRVPAPGAFRRELGDWLAQPRRAPWWWELMEPVRQRIPAPARRPVVGAAIGLGAAAAIAISVVAVRRRLLAGDVVTSTV